MKPNSQSTQYWRMKSKKKSIKKRPKLTCHTCNSDHKTKITPWKAN
jgi:hypothetical protein